jgi:hypothetical protein
MIGCGTEVLRMTSMKHQTAEQETSPDASDAAPIEPPQYSVQSMFVFTTWAAIWMGAWGVSGYLNDHRVGGAMAA